MSGLAADACSTTSESAFGSAADAAAWVCLEQNGPWGRVAAEQSHLDPRLGAALDRLVSAAGGRFALVRAPGPHADDHHAGAGHVLLLACASPSAPWLLRGVVRPEQDLQVLLRLDVQALVSGDHDAVVRSLAPEVTLVPDDEPSLLVCTNGRRDVCCAVRGRPVAGEAAQARPGQVWETSHTGGHRFAPTAVLLPTGSTLARLDGDLAVLALDGARVGELPARLHGPVHDRGLSGLPAAARAAQSAARAHAGEDVLAALAVAACADLGDGRWRVEVVHPDGRAWTVEAVRGVVGPDRPESCGKAAVARVGWTTTVTAGSTTARPAS